MRTVVQILIMENKVKNTNNYNYWYPKLMYTIRVAEKTKDHPFHGKGSKFGYTVNGKSGGAITLTRGTTYTFDISANGHPFYFTTSDTGAVGFPGSVMGDVIPIEVGKMVIKVDDRFPKGQQIYYQCGVHPKMGGFVAIEEPKKGLPRPGDLVPVSGIKFT